MTPESTGATAKQIENAAKTWMESVGLEWTGDYGPDDALWCLRVHEVADHLVPPGYAIIGPEMMAVPRSLIDTIGAWRTAEISPDALADEYDAWKAGQG
jgi:hypothetical protein